MKGLEVQANDGEALVVGRYGVLSSAPEPHFERSKIPCPYCKEPMRLYRSDHIYRIMKVREDEKSGIGQPIPSDSHVLLVCSGDNGGCEQGFTMLRSEYEVQVS